MAKSKKAHKHPMCNLCSNDAVYESNNSYLTLCEECYQSMQEDYNRMYKDKNGCSFEDYFGITEISD